MTNPINLLMMPTITKFKAYQENSKSNKMDKKMVKIGTIKYKNSKPQKMSNKELPKICLKNSMLKKITIKKTTFLSFNSKATKMIFCSKKATMPFSAKKSKKQLTSKSSNN